MVNIILCGCPGSGKEHLAKRLNRTLKHRLGKHKIITGLAKHVLRREGISKRKDYDADDDKFCYVQEQIVQESCNEELVAHRDGVSFINTDSVINTLVLLKACFKPGEQESFYNLLGRDDVKQVLEMYKRSLVVILKPQQFVHDDLICLKLKYDDWMEMKSLYVQLLFDLHIPFIDIRFDDDTKKIEMIAEALAGSKIELDESLFNMFLEREETNFVQNRFLFVKSAPEGNREIQIPTLKVYSEHYIQIWTTMKHGQTNRFIHRHGHEKLLCIEFDINVKSTWAQKVLLKGIYVNGEPYVFLACTDSGLKERKCYLWRGPQQEVDEIIESNGDFSQIQTVSKRLARIGLLFSGVQLTTQNVSPEHMVKVIDIESNGKVFTDGCGAIGMQLATQIFQEVDDITIDKDYLPSVYQVRLQGYKGVLAVDPGIEPNSILLRDSMEKFRSTAHPFIGICNYSRPYTFGYLNKQFIMMLSGLGIPDFVFQQKHEVHLNNLQNMLTDTETAIDVLQWQNEFGYALLINSAGGIHNLSEERRRKVEKVLKAIQQNENSKLDKLRILIPKSRNIFGVCDTQGILEYGQCFLRLTVNGRPKTICGLVVVCKNPCYLTSDVRVLEAVSDIDNPNARSLNHLVDCIVFPTKGKRPHADEIAGSDLDGDQFFVCWDEALIPNKTRPPYDYPSISAKPQGAITHEKVISYFSKQNETRKLIGRVNKLYNLWADRKGVNSTECELLGQLFSRAIDASKSGDEVKIPKGLQNVEETDECRFVWGCMEQTAKQRREAFANDILVNRDDVISLEFVLDIGKQMHGNITSFDKLTLFIRYVGQTDLPQDEHVREVFHLFGEYLDFNTFAAWEKSEAIAYGFPKSIVLNALNTSKILFEEDLKHFSMGSPFNQWSLLVHMQHDDFKWNHLLKAVTEYDNTLVVLRLEDDLIIELQILERLELGNEQLMEGGKISSILHSRHFGYNCRYILGDTYYLDLSENTLQLYRDKSRERTFIWLQCFDKTRDEMTMKKQKIDPNATNAISTDLQRYDRRILESTRTHPKVRKAQFKEIEIFVRSLGTEAPYYDIYDVNDLLPVEEEFEPELEVTDADSFDFVDLFHERVQLFDSLDREEQSQELLKAANVPDLSLFDNVLQCDGAATAEAVYMFRKLLENIIVSTVPFDLPEQTKHIFTNIVLKFVDVMAEVKPSEILKIGACLTRLGQDASLLSDMFGSAICDCTMSDMIEAIANWDSFYFLSEEFAIAFLEGLSVAVLSQIHENVNESANGSNTNVDMYLHRVVQLHTLHLLSDIGKTKDHMQTTDRTDKVRVQNQSITHLKLNNTADMENDTIVLYHVSAVEGTSKFLKGQYVALSRQIDLSKGKGLRSVCCICQVKDISVAPFNVTLKIEGNIPTIVRRTQALEGIRFWRIDLIGNIVTYNRIVSALKVVNAKGNQNDLLQIITSPSEFELKRNEQVIFVKDIYVRSDMLHYEMTNLNTCQTTALKTALENTLTLIQGPPGTGKTEVACQIVKRLLSMGKEEKILIVAETNIAVDNIARRLRKDAVIVRIGASEGIASDIYDISLEGQMRRIADMEARKLKVRDQQGDTHRNTQIMNRILSKAQVVMTTCAGAGDICLENYCFPYLLVDEATQTLETTLLCSIAHGANKLVLIGDPMQLGPTAVDQSHRDTSSPNLFNISQLSKTLFHRLYEKQVVPVCFLDTQYRMHPSIAMFPSEHFYDGRLKTGECAKRRPPIVFPWPGRAPLCFINVKSYEKKKGSSYYNDKEVDTVVKVVNKLFDVKEEERAKRIGIEDVGVITLYKAQVEALKSSVRKGIQISSVDGFQGQEKEVIIVSTVRSNEKGSVGFCGDMNRMNVLLTRAKRGLIIIGNANTLQNSEIWHQWLAHAPTLDVSKLEKSEEMETAPRTPRHKNVRKTIYTRNGRRY
ncbi:uncharacterized protein LOC128209691 [Mya arenaria]|uniref:uncharacterized protein LOC128209691 n=1 Tax=Mya arenaria TaxID=6604 RepID=UPI0022DF7AD8|nr:uncharacterized protein LOC128209691 [Mya arenaria]XP_052769824.1 uncharacterized protein LOC128209691 [Mya arenaria]